MTILPSVSDSVLCTNFAMLHFTSSAAMHGGKHMLLPATWMQPREDGEGTEIIELEQVPITTTTFDYNKAYMDTDSEEDDRVEKSKAFVKKKLTVSAKKQAHGASDSDDMSESYSGSKDDADRSADDSKEPLDKPRAEHGAPQLVVRPGLSSTVFVGSLNFATTEKHLTAAFGGTECVASVRMPRRRDGRRRGIGFVELKSRKLAKEALLKQGMLLMGRRINVREGLQDADKESLIAARQGLVRVRPPGCHAIFVGNLAWQDDDRLRRHFGQCGNITEVHFDLDRETGDFKRSVHIYVCIYMCVYIYIYNTYTYINIHLCVLFYVFNIHGVLQGGAVLQVYIS